MDPLTGFHFAIDLSDEVTGYFTECSGLGSEHEVIEHKAMSKDGKKEIVQMIPGRLKWENITLKRGITTAMDMWDWRKMVEDGDYATARRNGSITMYDAQGNPAAEWTFDNAWPVKITGPQPKSDSNEIGIEELTIAHEGIRRTA